MVNFTCGMWAVFWKSVKEILKKNTKLKKMLKCRWGICIYACASAPLLCRHGSMTAILCLVLAGFFSSHFYSPPA